MKKRQPRVVRFPQTHSQLVVLRTLAKVQSGEGIVLDRHEAKAAGTMCRVGEGTKPCVERRWMQKEKRSRYRITEEGRLALARVEAEEDERMRRFDPFGPQAARR